MVVVHAHGPTVCLEYVGYLFEISITAIMLAIVFHRTADEQINLVQSAIIVQTVKHLRLPNIDAQR